MGSLTRRAREYFEIFDELYEDGYVPHEIWQTLNKAQQESQAKMTVRLVEDALIEHGYSKGCSNEQKKYRTRWLQDRGLTDIENLGIESAKSDPIVGAVEAFKKRIEKEAYEKAEQAVQSMQLQLNKTKEEYADLKQEHQTVLNDRNLAINELNKLKHTNESLESGIIKFKQDYSMLESKFNTAKKQYDESIKNEKMHHEKMMQTKDNSIKHLTEETKHFRSDYKQSFSELKEQAEKQRHDFIAKIDALTTDNQKLSKALHKAEMTAQKTSDQCQMLQKQLNQLKDTYDDLNKEFKQKTDLLLKSEKQISALDSKINELKSIITDEKSQKQILQEKLLDSQKNIGKLTTDNNYLKQQINNLKKSKK